MLATAPTSPSQRLHYAAARLARNDIHHARPQESPWFQNAATLVPQIRAFGGDAGHSPPSVTSPVKALDVAAATELLRREQKTKVFDLGNGQRGRCDTIRFASNNPVEDEYSVGSAPGPGGNPWTFFAVFDGHAGWATSLLLRDSLIPFVSDALEKLPADATSPQISDSITKAFLDLDQKIDDLALDAINSDAAHPGSPEVLANIAPAISGSCALLAAYDSSSATVRVACVGDSRAVLGRANPDSKTYTAIPLSTDQTGKNDAEYARLTAAHPNEPDLLDRDSGRILGLAVTRAFGDHRWKWPAGAISKAQEDHWGTKPRPHYHTPPYLTAEPAIQEARVQVGRADAAGPARSDFLILASDGFWDHFSNEDAVACVARWIDAPRDARELKPPRPELDPQWWMAREPDGTPGWKGEPQFFVAEDDNAATHLVRNAFGGSRRRLFCGVMSAYPPMSRNVRDDITVQVIFFGNVREGGVVGMESGKDGGAS
ncbi:Protein phosphatase 2C manganese/magnesium aspartate binding site [Macrophomina phaseolina MS6]|uniref:Protein phosphatase 2C manganese/magnesium aspartate binding site n=1 Tax=Macrophomina phaseolina (strain MS6) TaxID=1126212 RepID=K2RI37_MACPH|nr:Protein phosphatase 2C manganese/magnesium aspartate binding site [Macrophomina phaseolina MS6]